MPGPLPRCRIVPLPGRQSAFEIDGRECTRWHFAEDAPRPFFYPVIGPGGSALTRMGHPGAPNHDHHRSVWFAHAQVLGIDFWSDNTPARVRQKQWLVYHDADDEAVMAVDLGWYDGHDPQELLTQRLIAAVRPLENGEWLLELQSTFTPTAESLELGKTNFGFLAVRVASNLSEHFGGGTLTSSSGLTGEKAIFGKPARWMDYSGPVPVQAEARVTQAQATEGVTYFDHPQNANFPAHWHVREDGWMGAAPGMHMPLQLTRDAPLTLRYLLHVHLGGADTARSDALAEAFARSVPYRVAASRAKHQMFAVSRVEGSRE